MTADASHLVAFSSFPSHTSRGPRRAANREDSPPTKTIQRDFIIRGELGGVPIWEKVSTPLIGCFLRRYKADISVIVSFNSYRIHVRLLKQHSERQPSNTCIAISTNPITFTNITFRFLPPLCNLSNSLSMPIPITISAQPLFRQQAGNQSTTSSFQTAGYITPLSHNLLGRPSHAPSPKLPNPNQPN
jgi:hypothetical protein